MNKKMVFVFSFVCGLGALDSLEHIDPKRAKAFECVNTYIYKKKEAQVYRYSCTRCNENELFTLRKLIAHKHAPDCVSNRECVDCRLANALQPKLIPNSFTAVHHANTAHKDMKLVHCHLCGLRVYRKLYEKHLKNPLCGIYKKHDEGSSEEINFYKVITSKEEC